MRAHICIYLLTGMAGRAANCKLAKCVDANKAPWLPNGLIIVETARFSLLGVLLKLNALPTLIFVLAANLLQKGEKERAEFVRMMKIIDFIKQTKY